MAKVILWFFVISGFVIGAVTSHSGVELELFTRISILSGLGILAICESIEKSKG
jgi:hypothetical protein